ncbi:MAG TPA: hypothetical protein VL096_10555, partial [Pirellulaceae bacterium]|nr:hypothetical protein [Pirellulaceae bacterium]
MGDYIYLPKAFYDALHRLAQDAKAAPQGWIVYDANYLGRLQWETIGVKLSFAELSIAYDLEVFHPNTRVTLALGRENVHLLNDHVILEGEAIDIEWLESGEGFTFPVSKPGRYRLELGVKPAVRAAAARAEVDIKIPRLARSHLLLKLPADAPAVQMPRALGALTAGEPGELRVELGPAERLAVQWKTSETAETPTGEVEASQPLWWKIRPGATILEAVWKFKSTGQPLREVRLVTDPRLRLLPLDAKEPVQEHFVRDGDVKAIQFVLKEPYEREVTIRTTFSLVGASGIGNVALPQLDAVADRFTRRWLAITAAPTLLAEVDSAASTTPLTAQEFLTAWGEAEATPQQTYVLTAGGAPFSLAVQPREPKVEARQELSYRIAARRTAVQLTSDVVVDEGQLFQHHITVPEGFTASEVTIDDGKAIRATRFAWANPHTLVAFMPTAMSGSYRVTVSGEYAMPERGNWQLPLLSLSDSHATTNLITIERSSDVSVQLADLTKDYLPATSLVSLAPSMLARLQPRDPQKLAPIGIQFAPLQVQFKAQQVIAITRNNDAWQASIDCFGDVVSGQLDTLRWEIPGDWTGPFRSSVPATIEVVTIPGQTRRQLVVRFQSVLEKQFHVQITAPLANMPGERLQLPELNLLDPL